MTVAMGKIAVLWAVAAGTLWLHALLGIPGRYLGQGYPLYPGLKVTYASLAMETAVFTLPVLLVAALGRWLGARVLVIPVVWALCFLAADVLIGSFVIDFGTTWGPNEALRELFLHPIHTPLALLVLTLASWWALTRRPRG